jgi:glutathione S-transferase
MSLVLHGYRYSVYVRIARLALVEKGVAYDRVEVNPFAPDVPASYLALHPFNRVPTLVHDGFTLYETGAITRYIARAFPGPSLQPTDPQADPQALARMDQVIGIVDAYAYWPLVRQVFSHRVFRPRSGQPGDEAEIARGLQASTKVLAALEPLVGEGLTLADLHLGAMIAYFVQAPEGRQALSHHPRLAAWWARLSARPSFAATEPGLPDAPAAQSR